MKSKSPTVIPSTCGVGLKDVQALCTYNQEKQAYMLMRYVLRYTSEWYKHQATKDKEKE